MSRRTEISLIGQTHLALVEGLCLDLPLLFETVNDVLVTPADLMGQTLSVAISKYLAAPVESATHLDGAVLAAGLQPQHSESFRDDHALFAVIRRGDTLEELETLKGGSSACSLVGDHATDCTVEDFGGSPVMERTGLLGVDDMALMEEVVVPELAQK
jgi:hypothetical protein